MTWTVTLSSKGQMVLPKAIRDTFQLTAGSKLLITERDGGFELRPVTGSILDWYGSQPVDGPQDWHELRDSAHRARAAEVIRETEGD